MRYIRCLYLEGISLTGYTRRVILQGMAKVKLDGYRCDRCGHEWLPRDKRQDPKVCPRCKSPYWNTPRKVAAKPAKRSKT